MNDFYIEPSVAREQHAQGGMADADGRRPKSVQGVRTFPLPLALSILYRMRCMEQRIAMSRCQDFLDGEIRGGNRMLIECS
jgi:hypothetical protein